MEEDAAISKQRNLDHSLDHYFDQLNRSSHVATSSSRNKSSPSATGAKVVGEAGEKSSDAARSVRGGASGLMSKPSSAAGASGRQHLHHHVADDFSDNGHPSSQTHPKRQANRATITAIIRGRIII